MSGEDTHPIPKYDHFQSYKNKIKFRNAVNGIRATLRSVSIAHTQPAVPKMGKGGATLARPLDIHNSHRNSSVRTRGSATLYRGMRRERMLDKSLQDKTSKRQKLT